MYSYQAKYISIHHGNVIIFSIDLGFKIFINMECVLLGVDPPTCDIKRREMELFIDSILSNTNNIVLNIKQSCISNSKYHTEVIYNSTQNLSEEVMWKFK